MKKTLSIVLCVLLVLLAVACSPETKQHEHKYEKVAGKSYAATCKSTGLDVYSCTECGDTYSVTLPLTDHSHAEDAEPTYGKNTDKPNCMKTGLGTYSCQYCGEDFVEVVPKDFTTHAYYDESSKNYVTMSNFDEDHMEWSDTAEIEKTYFASALKVAICNECGKVVEGLYEPVKSANNKYEYSQIIGTWIYKDLLNGVSYYFDVKEDQGKGTVNSTCTKITFDKTGVNTEQPTSASTSFVETNGYRSLSIYTDSKTFVITAEPGSGNPKMKCGSEIDLSDKTEKTLEFKESHNHFYSETETNSDFIEKDKKFSKMSFLGVVLCDETGHKLECSECGLCYIESKHTYPSSGNTDICKYCGYNRSSADGFVAVTINRANDPNTFEAAKESAEDAVSGALYLYEKYNASSLDESASEILNEALTYANSGKTALEKYGLTDSEAYSALAELLEDPTGGTGDNNTNIYYALNHCGENNLEDTYDTLLETLAENLASSYANPDYTVNGVTYNSANYGCSSELKNYINGSAVEVDKFYVARDTVLPLEYEKYVSSEGITYNFAENCGWSVDYKTVKIVSGGFQVRETCTLTFAEKL